VALVIWSPSYRLAWFDRQTVVVAAPEGIGAVPRRRAGSALFGVGFGQAMVACEKEGTMTANTLSSSAIAAPGRSHLGRILVGSALMFVVLQGGLSLLFPRLDLTWS
jgi:hypothetical protein